MKKLFFVLLVCITATLVAQGQSTKVLVKTTMGDISLMLYDDTPMHKENFIKLVNSKFYDGILFHRVMEGFMIQVGDPNYRVDENGAKVKGDMADYRVPAEFRITHYHKKGALAAARTPDRVNPDKESSGSQFYIVHGRKWSKEELDRFDKNRRSKFTEEERKIYTEFGGYPSLDFEYTVFGEVTSGLDVVDAIAAVKRNMQNNKPIEDVKILSVSIIK